ncbi:MAG: hypothetical protein KOO66_03375 [Bacteroidales bacterium]|nr:hypothetical protein [Bacteroidales bacterium]
MKKLFILVLFGIIIISACERDRPGLFVEEANLKIENTSETNFITGVYYSTVGYGSNRISTYIGPGESKMFTLNTEDDDVYDIKVTSDMSGSEEFIDDHHEFGWDETYVIELTDDGWYTDDDSWF